MIVPRARLLFWVASAVLPFALLGALAPASAGLALLVVLLVLGLAAADAVAGWRGVRGLAAELPPVVRLAKDRPGGVSLRLYNPVAVARPLKVALAWPAEIAPESETTDTLLPAQAGWTRITLNCTPRQRGRYAFTATYLEDASPLGFWAVRKTVPGRSELHVYPNLLPERKTLGAVFLNRGLTGLHTQRQVGKGREFEKLREYVPGDGYDDIHWKATARRGRPVTKVFHVERTQEVYVVADASRLSARPMAAGGAEADATPVLEQFLAAALTLGLAAEQQGDRFGVVTFADRVEKFVRAGSGQAHYGACRDALYRLQPQAVTPDFDELGTFLRLRLRRRALLIFLTSLDDPAIAASFVRNLEPLRRQHLVLAAMVRPPALRPMFTGAPAGDFDALYAGLGGHLRWRRLQELRQVLRRHGVQLLLPDRAQLCGELVSQYMAIKQRQLL